jgi:hypothetical protein
VIFQVMTITSETTCKNSSTDSNNSVAIENKHVALKAVSINARTKDNEKNYISNLYSIKFNE